MKGADQLNSVNSIHTLSMIHTVYLNQCIDNEAKYLRTVRLTVHLTYITTKHHTQTRTQHLIIISIQSKVTRQYQR